MNIKKISVVIPVYNERLTLGNLFVRLYQALKKNSIEFELIFVDGGSTDGSFEFLSSFTKHYNIKVIKKESIKGKAACLIEGFKYAEYPLIAILDADLQYPPENLPKMIELLEEHDLVVGYRKKRWDNFFRNTASYAFSFLFGRLLLGLNYDVQAMKVFKKDILEATSLSQDPWSFDIDFLYKVKKAGFKIGSAVIDFENNPYRPSRFQFSEVAYDLGTTAIKLRVLPIPPTHFTRTKDSMKYAGVHHRRVRFITHTTIRSQHSAVTTLTSSQKLILFSLGGLLLASFVLNWHLTLVALFSSIVILYFLDLLFNVFIIFRSLFTNPEIVITDEDVHSLKEERLPLITVLCPLYKEESILPQFIEAMSSFDYPKDKLQVLLLLEEDDRGTIDIANKITPPFIKILIVPNSLPRTKPKALNWGLGHAKGEYIVIYDAEDVPEKDQLKKAIIAFDTVGKDVFCLQAKLNFYNPNQNLLTRLFAAEYSLWFDLILTGLHSIAAPIPLGGTSNFFRTKDIINVEGWDAFNVCEDCDLGLRLYKRGHRTALFNSTTFEEANSNLDSWIKQRSHWIKGYIQSFFVHIRSPRGFMRSLQKPHFFTFLLVVGGKTLSVFINPFLWIMTISYFLFRPFIGPLIESFYPAPIFYLGLFTLMVGNLIYLYNYMLGAAHRGHWHLVELGFLVPFYWLLMSFAAWKALYQILVNPYYWEKTTHGLHLNQNIKL